MMSKIQNALDWIYGIVFPDASSVPRAELRYMFFILVLSGLVASSAALAVGLNM